MYFTACACVSVAPFLQADKLRTTSDYDNVVTAELPNSTREPELFSHAARHMMHGPCGSHWVSREPQPVCCSQSSDGTCKRYFPKEFCNETTCNENGYPVYRRPDVRNSNGERPTVFKKGVVLDNRWVTGYNRVLLQRCDVKRTAYNHEEF